MLVIFSVDGLYDRARSGRPALVDELMVVAETLTPPPVESGLTHWSSRDLAKRIKVSHNEVASIWRAWGIQPHRTESFTFSTDPELEAKITDIVGMYLDPPENAIVLCIDEKSQVQALERSQPMLPVAPGLAERRAHDYFRHGTTSLFAAPEVATGKVTEQCHTKHTNREFLAFLKHVAKEYPDGDLHIVVDNYRTHKHANVTQWLARPKNKRITLHFTPTGCSWMNLVEVSRPGCKGSAGGAGSVLAASGIDGIERAGSLGGNYRTGAVGGHAFLETQLANPVDTGMKSYGAGLLVKHNGTIGHDGAGTVS